MNSGSSLQYLFRMAIVHFDTKFIHINLSAFHDIAAGHK